MELTIDSCSNLFRIKTVQRSVRNLFADSSFESASNQDRSTEFALAFEMLRLISCEGEAPPSVDLLSLNKSTIVFGRGSPKFPVDVPIKALKNGKEVISRNHASIVVTEKEHKEHKWELRDMNSLNGVFVNDVKITSHVLQDDDVVQFGGLKDAVDDTGIVSIRFQFSATPRPPLHPLNAPKKDAKEISILTETEGVRNVKKEAWSAPQERKQKKHTITAYDADSYCRDIENEYNMHEQRIQKENEFLATIHRLETSIKAQKGTFKDNMKELTLKLEESEKLRKECEATRKEVEALNCKLLHEKAIMESSLAALADEANDEKEKEKSMREGMRDTRERNALHISHKETKKRSRAMKALLRCHQCKQVLLEARVDPNGFAYCRPCVDTPAGLKKMKGKVISSKRRRGPFYPSKHIDDSVNYWYNEVASMIERAHFDARESQSGHIATHHQLKERDCSSDCSSEEESAIERERDAGDSVSDDDGNDDDDDDDDDDDESEEDITYYMDGRQGWGHKYKQQGSTKRRKVPRVRSQEA